MYNLLGCVDRASKALDLEADSELIVKVSLYSNLGVAKKLVVDLSYNTLLTLVQLHPRFGGKHSWNLW